MATQTDEKETKSGPFGSAHWSFPKGEFEVLGGPTPNSILEGRGRKEGNKLGDEVHKLEFLREVRDDEDVGMGN